MSDEEELVYFTVPEFAFLVHRTVGYIQITLQDGRLKGRHGIPGSVWRIPESELVKYWGNLYGRPKRGQ